MPGQLIFRCKLCDETFNRPHPDVRGALMSACVIGRIDDGETRVTHACGDGLFGLAELIGSIPAELPASAD